MAEAYTVLARRYRSQNFDELVGQEAIAQTLKNAITANRVAHAFLFTGTRGVGKTSAARILAKAINCPNSTAGQPCGTCEACKAIARGEDMDVIEIDGASNNGVDQVRELRANAGIRPARSPYKIYIIDEVHMLSTGAFNALLKTLEEPPEHVKFIFATTDIHKVPATIISRCQRFDFKNIPTVRIAEHLKGICRDEGIEADADALHRIARLGNGSMRDALSLLDRVLSLGEKHLTEKLLEELLGKPATTAIAELVDAITQGDAGLALKRADVLLKDGMSAEQVLGELVEFFRNLMLLSVCGPDTDLLEVSADLRSLFANLATRFDGPTLVHLIALCEQTLRALKSTTMSRPLFDALLVRLALSEQFSSLKEIIEQVGHGSAALPAQKKNDITAAPITVRMAAAPVVAPQFTPAPPAAPASEPVEGYESPHGVAAAPIAAPPAATQVESPPEAPAAVMDNPSDELPAQAALDTPPEAERSVFQEMQAALTRNMPQPVPVQPYNGRPGSSGRPRPSAPAAAQQPVMPLTPPVGPEATWEAVRQYCIQTRAGSINTMLDGRARLISCDPAAAEATLEIPVNLQAWFKDTPRLKIEESLKALFGRSIRLTVMFTDDAGAAASQSHHGLPPTSSLVQRVPQKVVDAVHQAPIIQRIIQAVGGDVTSIEIIDIAPDPE